MEDLLYNKTKISEGSDCLITRNAHIVKVDENYFIVTCSSIFNGWMGVDTSSKSFVYTNYQWAVDFCEG